MLGLLAVTVACISTVRVAGAGQVPSSKPEPNAPNAGARVVALLGKIDASLTDSRYSPITYVNPKLGVYEFDCSGMVSWVLQRAAPGAWQSVRAYSPTGRLVARDFVRAIAAVSDGRPTWSWQRVIRIEDAEPGDVIAWLKPQGWQSAVTGHVGFVLARPVASRRAPGAFLVRFADASRYQHQDDSRAASGRDGFGSGTVLFVTDSQTGAPTAYGWFGDESAWVAETQIVIGRPRR